MTSTRNPHRPLAPSQNVHSWPTTTAATRQHTYLRPTYPAPGPQHAYSCPSTPAPAMERGQGHSSPATQPSTSRRPSTKTSPRVQILLQPASSKARRANALLVQGAASPGRTLSRAVSLEQVLANANSQAASLAPTENHTVLRASSMTTLRRPTPTPPHGNVPSRPVSPLPPHGSVPSRPASPLPPHGNVPSRPASPLPPKANVPSRPSSPAPSLLRPSSPARPVRHSNLDVEEMAAFYMSHPHSELIAQAVAVMRRMKAPHREPIEKILPDVAKVVARLEPEIWQYRSPDSPEYKFWTELVDLKIRVLELKERCAREQARSESTAAGEGIGAAQRGAEKTKCTKRWWKLKRRRSRVVSPPTTNGNQVDGELFGNIFHILTRRKRRNTKSLCANLHRET